MRFTVEISLGGAAMETPEHIACALASIASAIELFGYTEPLTPDCAVTHPVMDDNGNTVGEWSLK